MTEVQIPAISGKMGLTLEEAKAEYSQLLNAAKPRFGWCSGVQNRINTRLEELKTMVFDHTMKGTK